MARARDSFAQLTQQNAKTPQDWAQLLIDRCMSQKPYVKTTLEMIDRADLSYRDKYGQTPLMGCASHNHHEIAKVLIARKVDLDAQTNINVSALIWGTRHNADETVLAMIDAGASLDLADDKGLTALHIAAAAGNPVLTEALIKAGAMIDIRDHYGRTPLFGIAASGYAEDGILSCAKLLLAAGADLDIPDQTGILPEQKLKANLVYGADRLRYPRIAALFTEHRIEQLRRIGNKSMRTTRPIAPPKLRRKG